MIEISRGILKWSLDGLGQLDWFGMTTWAKLLFQMKFSWPRLSDLSGMLHPIPCPKQLQGHIFMWWCISLNWLLEQHRTIKVYSIVLATEYLIWCHLTTVSLSHQVKMLKSMVVSTANNDVAHLYVWGIVFAYISQYHPVTGWQVLFSCCSGKPAMHAVRWSTRLPASHMYALQFSDFKQ